MDDLADIEQEIKAEVAALQKEIDDKIVEKTL